MTRQLVMAPNSLSLSWQDTCCHRKMLEGTRGWQNPTCVSPACVADGRRVGWGSLCAQLCWFWLGWDFVSMLSKCQSKGLHRFILVQGNVQIMVTKLRAQMFVREEK